MPNKDIIAIVRSLLNSLSLYSFLFEDMMLLVVKNNIRIYSSYLFFDLAAQNYVKSLESANLQNYLCFWDRTFLYLYGYKINE